MSDPLRRWLPTDLGRSVVDGRMSSPWGVAESLAVGGIVSAEVLAAAWLHGVGYAPSVALRRECRPSARTAMANSGGAKVLTWLSRRYAWEERLPGSAPHAGLRAFQQLNLSPRRAPAFGIAEHGRLAAV